MPRQASVGEAMPSTPTHKTNADAMAKQKIDSPDGLKTPAAGCCRFVIKNRRSQLFSAQVHARIAGQKLQPYRAYRNRP